MRDEEIILLLEKQKRLEKLIAKHLLPQLILYKKVFKRDMEEQGWLSRGDFVDEIDKSIEELVSIQELKEEGL